MSYTLHTGDALGYRTKGMFSSIRSDWATPRQLFEMLHQEFNFTLDVCATRDNLPVEDIEYFDYRITDALSRQWMPLINGSVWCNPPYGRKVGFWIEKAYREAKELGVTVVMLLPARTDTSWWHDYCMKGEIRFLRGRLSFDEKKRGRAPFPSAIVIFGGRRGN